ncbi:hypothetical protein NW766_001784 [Fusarium irregulare]|uniref:Uncharacterized protein n=1 Tax=Fusarium irregulare TaxID=2494466 RepID=A0A9W8Q0M9_9HYPO|nr:hypothetical protein NW766_001784 [Fusarium irregulare]
MDDSEVLQLHIRISEAREHLLATADDHPERAAQLHDLATLLNDRYFLDEGTQIKRRPLTFANKLQNLLHSLAMTGQNV